MVSAVIVARATTLDTPVSMASFKGIYQQLGTFYLWTEIMDNEPF